MKKKYLFSISILISLLIILIPAAIATEIDSYGSVLKTKEQKINLYQSPSGDTDYPSDPGKACVEQSKKTNNLVKALDNDVISVLVKITDILFFICTVTAAIDKVVNTISLALGMISKDFCCPAAATGVGAGQCVAATAGWNAWSIPFELIKKLCCFVNCGWCTGEDCWGAILPFHLGKIGNLGFLGPGVGIAQMGISPYDNIYTAIGCMCPLGIIFNLRKLKAIYQAYDCCIQEACANGLSTDACERQLDEATCMYWEGSFYNILAKLLITLIAAYILGPIIQKLAQQAIFDRLFACVFAAFKIVEGIKTVKSVTTMYSMYIRQDFQTDCSKLEFDDVKESILDDWEHVTLVDRDGDNIYDSTVKNYVEVDYSGIPNKIKSKAKEDSKAKVYTIKEIEEKDKKKEEVVKKYWAVEDKTGNKKMYAEDGTEVKGLDKLKIEGRAISTSNIMQTYDDNSVHIEGVGDFARLEIGDNGELKGITSDGKEQALDLDLNKGIDRATILQIYGLTEHTKEMGEFERVNGNTIQYKEGSIQLQSNEEQQQFIIDRLDKKTTTITHYNNGATLTQTQPKEGTSTWEFQIDGRKASGEGEINNPQDTSQALSQLGKDLTHAKDIKINNDGSVEYKKDDRGYTISATPTEITKTETWEYSGPEVEKEERTIKTVIKTDGTKTIDLKKGTTQIATGLDPSLIGGVENIDWALSDEKKVTFTDTKIPILGIALDKSYVTQDVDGTFKIYEEWNSDNNVGLHPTAYISIDQATGARIIKQIEGMLLGEEQYTVISIIKDGRKIDINPNLFEANQPFRGLEGEELVQTAEAYDALDRPANFKIDERGYNNGKEYGSNGYKEVGYTSDNKYRFEESYGGDSNYRVSRTDVETGRIDYFTLSKEDTGMTFQRMTIDGKEVFAAGSVTAPDTFTKTEINGYNIIFEDGELKAITPDGRNKYSLQITDQTPNAVKEIAEDQNVKTALENKEAAKEIIEKDQKGKKEQEEKKKEAEKRKTKAEKIAQSKEKWDALSRQSYEIAWDFLYLTLGGVAHNFIEDKCKEDYQKSYPASDTPTDSGGTATCEDTSNNIYNAQFISKTEQNDNTCQYKVTYGIGACNHEINFVVQFQGTGSNENIEGGTLAQGQSVSRERIITSNQCTHQRICIIIKGEDTTKCFPPINPEGGLI